MMRGLMLLGLPAAASAVHLSGPMNDAMVACGAANCADFMALMAPGADVQGTGLPLSAFLAPPLNAVPFIYNMEYALNVMGYTGADGSRVPGEFSYRATPNSADAPVPQNLTATATTDLSAAFGCMCTNCGAMVEAIFQPVGRGVCQTVVPASPLPCQTEFDACQAATTRPDGFTGTAAGMDVVYPPVMPPTITNADGSTSWASSTDVCQPEAAFGAYKAAYDLSTACAAGDTTIGGSAEALTLAKCVAASRNEVYLANDVAAADSDIGGFTCGLDYGEVPSFPCSLADAALYDFDANTIDDTASDACKTCVAGATDGPDISPCIGPPECVAHQFTPSVMVSPPSVVNMICTGLRTSLCDAMSMNIINEKKAFFADNPNCPAPSPPPSFGCGFDNADVASWQAGSPYTGASDTCVACLTTAESEANRQSTCWGPPACAQPAFAGMALSMPPSSDVRNMICYGVGNAGRDPAWGEDTTDCDAEAQAVIDSKKAFFGCPTTGLAVNFPCTFDADVPVYARAKAGTGSMMAMPNLACYQCITANNNNIAPCIGPPACVAAAFTPEIMGGGMPGIIDTICTGLCTDTCSDNDNMVIAEKQALMGGGCDARGTPVASTCPTEPTAEPAATEPAAEPAATEPAAEPAATEPAATEPAATEPAATAPAAPAPASGAFAPSALLTLFATAVAAALLSF